MVKRLVRDSLEGDGKNVLVGEQLGPDGVSKTGISLEEHVGDASLTLLENNVLQLLHVPVDRGEDLEAVSEHTDLVEVSHLNLAQHSVGDDRCVDPVELVDNTLLIEFFDDADGFLADGGLSLLCAGTAVMSSVDAGMLRNGMGEVNFLRGGLAKVDVCADPELWARLELG